MINFSMKCYVVRLVSLFAVILCCSQVAYPYPEGYPDYQTVVIRFFAQYKADFNGKEKLLFARTPEGWMVARYDYFNQDSLYAKGLFWSKDEADYVPLEAGRYAFRSDNSGPAAATDFLRIRGGRYSGYGFERNPFFGYPGWAQDVVRVYGEEQVLGDTLQEGLARAYSHLAVETIRPENYDYRNLSGEVDTTWQRATNSEIQRYAEYANLCLRSFKRLLEQNPYYETLVGNIQVKYANEHVHFYHLAMSVRRPEAARQFLKEDIYPAYMLTYARRLLESCKPHGLLFTNGDNDTFPLWYVQQVEGYRKDVRVMVMTYLNTSWFLEMLRDTMGGLEPLPVEMKRSAFYGVKNQSRLVTEANIPVNLPTHEAAWRANEELGPRLADLIRGDVVQWMVPTRGGRTKYLELKDVFLMELMNQVAAKQWNRPIYFAGTVSIDYFLGLDKFFVLEGLVYRVVPYRKDVGVHGSILGPIGQLDPDSLLSTFREMGPPLQKGSDVDRYSPQYWRLKSLHAVSFLKASDHVWQLALDADTSTKQGKAYLTLTLEMVQEQAHFMNMMEAEGDDQDGAMWFQEAMYALMLRRLGEVSECEEITDHLFSRWSQWDKMYKAGKLLREDFEFGMQAAKFLEQLMLREGYTEIANQARQKQMDLGW